MAERDADEAEEATVDEPPQAAGALAVCRLGDSHPVAEGLGAQAQRCASAGRGRLKRAAEAGRLQGEGRRSVDAEPRAQRALLRHLCSRLAPAALLQEAGHVQAVLLLHHALLCEK